jgi:signal transduction histidine kinase
MSNKSPRFAGIGPKIAIIPILAILALLSVKGVDWYLSSKIESATDSSERGSAIAVKLTESLFWETDYLSNPRDGILPRIDANNESIRQLVIALLANNTSEQITRSLEKIVRVMAQHKAIFLRAVETVIAINKTKSELTEHFRENDALLKEITDAIASLGTQLIMEGEYLHEAKREFRNSLKEFMGFTASQMLNINYLLSFSDEKRFIEAEEALKKRMLLVSTTCENLSLATGDPVYYQNWLKIFEKQGLIQSLRKEVYQLWRTRQALAKKLEATNQEFQKSALNIVNEAEQQIDTVREYHKKVDIFTISITIALLAALSILVIRSLTRPLVHATEIMTDFSKGKLKGLSLRSEGRNDEIGELQESFGRMIDNTKEIVAMARSLAEGDYAVTIKPRSNEDELSLSLITMTKALKEFSDDLQGRSEQLEKLVLKRTAKLEKTTEKLIEEISERKRTEKELEKHREHLEELVAERTKALEEKTDKTEESRKALTYLVEDVNKAREDLEKANRDIGAVNTELQDFAYIVSHDLKAPLRAVSQLAYWISEDYAEVLDEDGKEHLNLLSGRVKRMDALINGILQYSRLGRAKEKQDEIDLDKTLPSIIETLAPPENIQITIEDELPEIVGNKTHMEQVFQNLIGNAIKFMDKPEGLITIGCRDEGSHWEFRITDNGPGIDEKYHERIFKIFQTLVPRDEHESTGIGLTLVKKTIDQYDGKVWVESEVGKGSSFLFSLPKIRREI